MENDKQAKSLEEIKQLIQDIPHYIIVANETDIPSKLKEWRVYRDLSLRDVQMVTNISNAYLSQLENGKTNNPSFRDICKLCRAYNVRLIID